MSKAEFIKHLDAGFREALSELKPGVIVNECEFNLRPKDTKAKHPGQSRLQFKSIQEALHHRRYPMTQDISLDISLDTHRASLSGLPTIRQYCVDSKIPKSATIIKKTRVAPAYDYNEYFLRLRLSNEALITDSETSGTDIITKLNDSSTTKLFRYKSRLSFKSTEGDLRFDLTMIKEASGVSMKSSGLLSRPEIYEVEVEYTGAPFTSTVDIDYLTRTFQHDLYSLLTWSQEALAVSTQTERKSILDEYVSLCFGSSGDKFTGDPRQLFISHDVLPLTFRHIIPTEGTGEHTSLSLLETGYAVTDKADGQHHLMMISNHASYRGRVYLINNRMTIKFTGYQIQNPDLYGSIYDSEFLKLGTGGTLKVAIFDALFENGKDIRDLPLLSYVSEHKEKDTGTKVDVPVRYMACQRLMENGRPIPLDIGLNLTFSLKAYQYPSKDETLNKNIFQLTGQVYQPEIYSYNLDGCIYTRYDQAYPKVQLGQRVKWADGLLKYKESKDQSIDFNVHFPSPTIKTKKLYERNPNNPSEMWEYREAHLQVGDRQLQKGRMVSVMANFNPTQYRQDGVYKVRLRVDPDGHCRARDGNIIYNGAIFEFIYDEQNSGWIPIRFRDDKTELKTANAKATAESTWQMIKNPIPLEVITGRMLLSPEVISKSKMQYYAQNEKQLGELVRPLRAFHTAIKSYQIDLATQAIRKAQKQDDKGEYAISLLDPTVGRAGDLDKWTQSRISYALGVDIDELNLTNESDGALARYQTRQREGIKFPKAIDFIWGDSAQLLNTGEAGLDPINRKLLQSVLSRRGPASFDLVSCQFAFHYFCASEHSLRNFLQNVSMNLKTGGYFIGTTLDGQKVLNKMKSMSSPDLSGQIRDIKVWGLQPTFPVDSQTQMSHVGQKIIAYNINIGHEIPEYLVNFEHFKAEAKKFGLIPVALGDMSPIESFETLFAKTHVQGKKQNMISKMTAVEKDYSFLNNAFAFQKVVPETSSLTTSATLGSTTVPTLGAVTVPTNDETSKIKFKPKPKPILKKPDKITVAKAEDTPIPAILLNAIDESDEKQPAPIPVMANVIEQVEEQPVVAKVIEQVETSKPKLKLNLKPRVALVLKPAP
jgi:hypothetical protein